MRQRRGRSKEKIILTYNQEIDYWEIHLRNQEKKLLYNTRFTCSSLSKKAKNNHNIFQTNMFENLEGKLQIQSTDIKLYLMVLRLILLELKIPFIPHLW